MNTQEAIELWKKYVIPCYDPAFPDEPMSVSEGKGAYIKDLEGKEYLDFFIGWGVSALGHSHPKIVEAIKQQSDKLIFAANNWEAYHPRLGELAEKLAKANTSGLTRSFFAPSGGEAIEACWIFAKKHTGKKEIISLMHSWHGHSHAVAAMTGNSRIRGPKTIGLTITPGVYHAPSYYCYRCHLGLEYPSCGIQCAKMIEDVINFSTTGDVAAFVAEPILGAGGNVPAPEEYFSTAKRILEKYGILFISDEVFTGFGKTGKFLGIESYNVKPDEAALSKAIGGEAPFAAVMISEQVNKSIEWGDHFNTYGGAPILMAAGCAAIDVLFEEKLIENADKMGKYFLRRLKELAEKHEIIGDVRGRGLILGLELVKNRKTKEPAVEENTKLRYEAKKRGLLVATNTGFNQCSVRINPPLIVTQDQIDKATDILDKCLEAI